MTILEQDVEYLDLDADGLPDAVRIVERLVAKEADGHLGPLETIETLVTEIGIDGRPRHVEVHSLGA
jgi:hypothetical protein